MPKYIVLSGRKQSGKTTSANFIKNELQARYPECMVEITSFAQPIKDFCINTLGLTKAQVYGSEAEKNTFTIYTWDKMPWEIRRRYAPPATNNMQAYYDELPERTGFMTAREVMQIFGTDIFRNFFDYDIWAKAPFRKNWGFTDYVIIDDCRFPNEAKAALENGATLIRLTRDVLGADQHISEKAMDKYPVENYHHVIDNNSYTDITRLFSDLNGIIRKIAS